MATTTKKKLTTVPFNWAINHREVQDKGFSKSKVFGTERTKFYLCAGKDWSYYLYLASSNEERITARLKYSVYTGSVAPVCDKYISNLSGDVSLDRSQKIGHASSCDWNRPMITVNEIIFEEDANKHSSADHREELCRKLADFRSNSVLSDVTLCTIFDGKEFPAHKVTLSAVSTVFEAMFCNEQFTENVKKRVEVGDIKGDIMETFLDYIYSGNITQKISQFAGELLVAADKYNIKSLLQACIECMLANITTETAAQYFYLGDLYKLPELKSKSVEFIVNNKEAVVKSDGWKQFIRPNPELFEQLFFLC